MVTVCGWQTNMFVCVFLSQAEERSTLKSYIRRSAGKQEKKLS